MERKNNRVNKMQWRGYYRIMKIFKGIKKGKKTAQAWPVLRKKW